MQLLLDYVQNAGVSAADIDIVILASSSPDDMFGDATTIAAAIGEHNMLHYSANEIELQLVGIALTLTRVLILLCNTPHALVMHTVHVHMCTTLTPINYMICIANTHALYRLSERHSSL
jgi:hypothetical protein